MSVNPLGWQTRRLSLAASMVLVLCACAGTATKNDANRVGYIETGKASFYSNKYQNKKTASGELFDQSSHTAAHKNLPFGTRVNVTNTENGKNVIVKINDRGPFIPGRIIDLSRSAFRRIGNTNAGVIDVKIEVVDY